MDTKMIASKIRTAIKQGNVEEVTILINSNRELLNFMSPFGTWLHVAATSGNLEIVKFLVRSGLSVNIKGGTFNTGAINRAASEGHFEVVKHLINAGAEFDLSEPDRNPLFAAIYGGHIEIVKLLLEKGIDSHITYSGGNMTNMDAYAFAIERGHKEIAQFLQSY